MLNKVRYVIMMIWSEQHKYSCDIMLCMDERLVSILKSQIISWAESFLYVCLIYIKISRRLRKWCKSRAILNSCSCDWCWIKPLTYSRHVSLHVCCIKTTGRSSFDIILQRSCVATIHLPVSQLHLYKGTSKMIQRVFWMHIKSGPTRGSEITDF